MITTDQHKTATLPKPHPHPVEISSRPIADSADDTLKNRNASSIAASSLAITWSVLCLIFFVFFRDYIAYYHYGTVDNVARWIRYPILTEAFVAWLPILVTTLILFIIGHIILIYFQKYLLQETVLTVLNLFVIAAVLSLLYIFPFDFTAIPDTAIASISYIFARVGLIGIVVALGVVTLVRLIKLMVNVTAPRTS